MNLLISNIYSLSLFVISKDKILLKNFIVRLTIVLNLQFRQTTCLQPKETIFHISKTTKSNISPFLPPLTHVKYRDQRINYKPVQFPIQPDRKARNFELPSCHANSRTKAYNW